MSTSNWQEYKKEDCPVCKTRGWCSYTTDDRGLFVMCMRPVAASHPRYLSTKPNSDGSQAYFVRPDGNDGDSEWRKPSASGNGNTHIDVADSKTRHTAYETLLGVLNLARDHKDARSSSGVCQK